MTAVRITHLLLSRLMMLNNILTGSITLTQAGSYILLECCKYEKLPYRDCSFSQTLLSIVSNPRKRAQMRPKSMDLT